MKHVHPLAAAAIVLALAACEVRRGDDAEEPAQSPSPAASETLALGADKETEPASIIRPDVTPTQAPDAPPDPLAVTISFAEGGYELDAADKRLLRETVASEQAGQGWPIVLRGHTDSEGNDQGNLFASRKRAEAVAGWLAENGIDADRISVIPLGEQRPVAPNARLDGSPDEEGRRKNRRVEIWIGPSGTQPGPAPGDTRGPAPGAAEPRG